MQVDSNFIVESRIVNSIKWLHFKIPTADYSQKYGDPEKWGSFRIYLTGFKTDIHLRLIGLELTD